MKTQIIVTSLERNRLTSCKPKAPDFGREKYLLHGCVGCTADVAGDHHQAARREAGQDSGQIDLEPQLKVFRLKVLKFRSKGCQGQVQDGGSYIWIHDEGGVSLEMKGFACQFESTFYLS